jgi:hypothetical protein
LKRDALQIEADPLTGHDLLNALMMCLYESYLCFFSRWQEFNGLVSPDASCKYCTAYHSAETGKTSHLIDPKTKRSLKVLSGDAFRLRFSGEKDFVQTSAIDGREGDNRFSFEKRAFNNLSDFHFRQFQGLMINEVGFAENDKAPFRLKKIKNLQMIPGLRHNAVISSYNEDCQIDIAQASY